MSVSTLTIPTPESCDLRCKLFVDVGEGFDNYRFCVVNEDVKDYLNIRHPNCPLTIQPEGMRWKEESNGKFTYRICPECDFDGLKERMEKWVACPMCGVKLRPSGEQ